MTLQWKQLDATTWEAKPWRIHFGEFSMVYGVSFSDGDSVVGCASFDELDLAKAYCEEQEND